ncbi:hypothetical protein BpHYR1_018991, partial [Brachionus plicatilis]
MSEILKFHNELIEYLHPLLNLFILFFGIMTIGTEQITEFGNSTFNTRLDAFENSTNTRFNAIEASMDSRFNAIDSNIADNFANLKTM